MPRERYKAACRRFVGARFVEGQAVKEGDALVTIEARSERVELVSWAVGYGHHDRVIGRPHRDRSGT